MGYKLQILHGTSYRQSEQHGCQKNGCQIIKLIITHSIFKLEAPNFAYLPSSDYNLKKVNMKIDILHENSYRQTVHKLQITNLQI